MIDGVDDWRTRAARARRRLAVRHSEEGRPAPELSAALVVARGERGLTVDEMAAELGCPPEVVAGLERGDVPGHTAPSGVRTLLGAMPSRHERLRGCLLAGAVGDALGAGIEFASLEEIRSRHGPAGVTGYVPAYGRIGAITDDTQLTLFTAEGLLRAAVGAGLGVGPDLSSGAVAAVDSSGGPSDVDAVATVAAQAGPSAAWPAVGDRIDGGPGGRSVAAVAAVAEAYRRWLSTQVSGPRRLPAGGGWLVGQPFLHHRRAPGNTCLSAIGAGAGGTAERPLNDSKGCGGVMRVAPVGLVGLDPVSSFRLAVDCAALTHGHPSGYLAAGVLGAVVAAVVDGVLLDDAVEAARHELGRWTGHEETSSAVGAAVDLWASGKEPSAELVEGLGAGWVAEEALAIALYCALVTPDVRGALLLAVNHSGDSDSTGAIAGNLLGAAYGVDAVPAEWLDALEGRDVIAAVADDLSDGGSSHPERYPAA